MAHFYTSDVFLNIIEMLDWVGYLGKIITDLCNSRDEDVNIKPQTVQFKRLQLILHLIATEFGTWHYDSALVPCAKFEAIWYPGMEL